jgi:cytidylate kinase
VREEGEKKRYFVGGSNVSDEIRSRAVTAYASQVSTYKEIRQVLLKTQRDFAKGRNAVFEGRDLGTVVFPEAEFKIFLTADPLVRAKRRLAEMRARGGEEVSEEELHREMQARDEADSLRAVAPLRPAEGAYFIDTTTLSIDEVVLRIVQYVKKGAR